MQGSGWVHAWLPEVFTRVGFLGLALWQWLGLVLAPLLAWLVGVGLGALVLGALLKLASRTQALWDDRLLVALRGPVRVLLSLLVLSVLIPAVRLPDPAEAAAERVLQTLLIVAAAWAALRMIHFVSETVTDNLVEHQKDALFVRGNKTRINVLRRMADVLVILIAAALVLMQFDVVRQVGVSILASAGIAGIALGFAAQKSISTLLAGLQLSVSQPVRIGDTVIVENEWGTIEEVTLTYVVVKIWDLRRLVVPITYFLEKPFQNWTRTSTELLGTVIIHADYRVPIDKIREEVTRLCKDDPNWDGKAAGLVVVDATERTVVLRALISAADASKQWDLRCSVREGLVKYLQQLEGGRYLPRTRVELPEGEAGARAGEQPPRASGAPPSVHA